MAKLYMMVTKDKYELPIAVAGSAVELARMCGVQDALVRSLISKHEHNGYINSPFRRVEVTEDTEELAEISSILGSTQKRGRKVGTH